MSAPFAISRFSLLYGALGFLLGFVFGALRELVLAPALGPGTARWIEFPLVTLAIVLLGLWLGRRSLLGLPALALAGIFGTILLVLFESAFALGALREPVASYLSHFNLLAGEPFPIGLLVMAIAPTLGGLLRTR